MTEAFVIVSITDDGGKWAPGTMLHAFPASYQPQSGDMASFHVERITSRKYTLDDLKAMRCKKVLLLSELMDKKKLDSKVVQKNNIHWAMCESVVFVSVGEITIKADLNRVTDFDSLTLSDCADEFKPKLIEVIPGEALDQLDAQRLR